MCYYVGAEVILANLLTNFRDRPATPSDISDYCKKVYIELRSKNNNQFAYFDISFDAIKNAVEMNSDIFEMFDNKIYRIGNICIEEFNANLEPPLIRALVQTSKQLVAA